jgi:putative YpdA family bacillithiol system oxidoreductase
MDLDVTTIAIIASLVPIAAISLRREMQRQRKARAALQAARTLGTDQPISLHPMIDPNRCVGCGGCVVACPEGDVLMIVDGRSRLVNAAHCVGHGACKSACPNNAIELVFGTSTRGVQLPELGPDYQTNVPGLYIAGELGGMGLIRNAIGQGVQAVANLERDLESRRDPGFLDVAIVGAGPAGIAAALACRQRGLSHVVLDQEGLGGSVLHYPRRKLVMSGPVDLPLVGRMHFREIGKEALLHFWTTVVRKASLQIRAPEPVTDVRRVERGFEVRTDRDVIRARRVLLAIGRRGTPRKLGVPGEESEKVSYRLLEPERWANRRVLVVGGGNSAIEAATALADAGADTTLSYRGAHLHRVAPANVERLEMQRGRNLHVLLESHLVRIEPHRVVIETPTGEGNLDNDQVFVLIGGELPADFLDKIGVRMRWHHGERPAAGAVAGGRP